MTKLAFGCHRTKLVLEDWWDPKVWLWIKMDTSSRLTIKPAVSSSSNQMGSWWQSLEPGEHQTDTLQVLHYIYIANIATIISLMMSLTGRQDADETWRRACVWARFTDFMYVSTAMLLFLVVSMFLHTIVKLTTKACIAACLIIEIKTFIYCCIDNLGLKTSTRSSCRKTELCSRCTPMHARCDDCPSCLRLSLNQTCYTFILWYTSLSSTSCIYYHTYLYIFTCRTCLE